jgi:cytoskeleton protein RodZ
MSTPSTENGESEKQVEMEVAESDTSPDARTRLGERLSQARQSKTLGLNEACERLRIRKSYLAALESGDWSVLPEEVYVIGFLRQYAALLGLDVSQEIEALKSGEYRLTKPFTMPDPPIAMNRTWALAAGACFLLLLILFNVVDEGEKGKSPPAPVIVPGETANQQPGAQPGPPAVVPQAALPVSGNVVTAPAETMPPALQSPAEPASASPPAAATVAAPAVSPAAAEAPKAAAGSSPAGSALPPVQATTQAPSVNHVYRLMAVGEDVWLQLHNPEGKLLKDALLRSGQSMEISAATDYLLLTAGNPLHLSLSIDGVPVAAAGSLGEKGKVMHDFRFEVPATPAAKGH